MSIHTKHLNVRPVGAFSDNYIWLIDSPRAPGRIVAVDPGDAAPVIAELQRSGATLAAILLTHHHPDHIGGVPQLLRLALTWDPANSAAPAYQDSVSRVRAQGNPPLPSPLGLETQVNPFLRCDEPAVVRAAEVHAGKALKESAEVFGVLRAWKDQFR